MIEKILVILIMFSFTPINFEGIFGALSGYITNLFFIIQIFTFIMGIFYIKISKKKSLFLHIYIVLFYAYLLLSTIYNSNLEILTFIKYTIRLGLYFYLLYIFNFRKKLVFFIKYYLIALNILNYIFYIFVPSVGVYTAIFGFPMLRGILANRNSVALYLLPLLMLINIYRTKWKLIYEILWLIEVLLTGSTAGIVVVSSYLYFKFINKRKTQFNIYVFLFIVLIIFLVFINFEETLVGFIISNVLGSDLTLSGRTLIWDEVLKLIPQKLFMGYGLGSYEIAKAFNFKNATNGHPINDPFNGILNILYFNGVIGLSFLLYFFYKLIRKIKKAYKVKVQRERVIIIFWGLLVIFLISISESIFQFSFHIIWMTLFFMYSFCNNVVKENNEKNSINSNDNNNLL